MSRKDQFLDRLPYYDTGENLQRIVAIIGSVLDQIADTAEDVRITRFLNPTAEEKQQLEAGEVEKDDIIATDQHLDRIANNLGVTRDIISFIKDETEIDVAPENDPMLRNRVNWNVHIQESSGFTNEVKELIAEGLQMYRVRTNLGGEVYDPSLEVKEWLCNFGPEWTIPDDHDGQETRVVEPRDINVFSNRETNCAIKGPDPKYEHGKFGKLTNFYQIDIPWKALPWTKGEEPLMWTSQDDFDDPSDPPTDTLNGWNHGKWGAEEEELVLHPLEILIEKTRAAGMQVGIYGNRGMIWRSQEEFADPSDPPPDSLHGWDAPMDGDLADLIWAKENLD